MTGSQQNPPIEVSLDKLLDNPTAGSRGRQEGLLAEFAILASAISNDNDVEWPAGQFPHNLASAVHAELHGQTPPSSRWQRESRFGMAAIDDDREASSNSTDQSAAVELQDLTADQDRRPNRGQLLGIAATILGFTLATIVLITIFRGFGDDSAPAAGGTSEGRVGQLAVVMQASQGLDNLDIFLVSLDSAEPVNLTNHPANDTFPTWSPDGSQLAFISDRSGADALLVMNADGTGIRELFTGDGDHLRHPSWSPTGDRIAFKRYVIDANEANAMDTLVVVSVADGDSRTIGSPDRIPAPGVDDTLEWSADGRWLAFGSIDGDDGLVMLADAAAWDDPSGMLPVAAEVPAFSASLSSSDELALGYRDHVRIVRFDPGAAEFVELRVFDAVDVAGLGWSPDGTLLALQTSRREGQTPLWIADSEGNGRIDVLQGFSSTFPVWSETNVLAFLRAGMIFSTDVDGYELMIFNPGTGLTTSLLDTGYSGPLLSPPAWRPAGRAATDATSTEPPTETPPTPSPAPTPGGSSSDILTPPQANMRAGSTVFAGYLSSYAWQFQDNNQTFGSIEAPLVPLTGDAVPVASGDILQLEIYGDEFSRPPTGVQFEVYPMESNLVAGTPPDTFTAQTEPLFISPASDARAPSIGLDFESGRYAIVARASWGPHPQISDQEIFITWVFDIDVQERADPGAGPVLIVKPLILSCFESATFTVSGFPPETKVALQAHRADSDEDRTVFDNLVTGPNGELGGELPVALIFPDCNAGEPEPQPETIELVLSSQDQSADGEPIRATAEIQFDAGNEAQRAIQIVRALLADANAVLTIDKVENLDGETLVEVRRQASGSDASEEIFDAFTVAPDHPSTISATLVSNSARVSPAADEGPLSEAEARVVAEIFYREHDLFGNSLFPIEVPGYVSIYPDEQLYGFGWQLQRDGVWLPTEVRVIVSATTGLVTGYSRIDYPYEGTLIPTLSEPEAHDAATRVIAGDPNLAAATIDSVRLTVTFGDYADAVEDGRAVLDMEARWRLAWEFSLVGAFGPGVDHLIWIDALTGEPLRRGP